MFAVIKTGGKQYRVAAEDVIRIERIAGEAGEIVTLDHVLMVGENEQATVGTPFVDGASVAVEIVEQGRAPKVLVFKKRRRKSSRTRRGHRQLLTTVRISEILTGGAKPSKKAAAPKKAEAKKAAPKEAKAEEAKAAPKAEDAKPAPKAEEKKAAPKAQETKSEESAAAPLFTAPKGKADDLTKVKGIGPVAKGQLAEQGITQFAQLAALSDDDVVRIDEAMPFSADQIKDWRDQAKALAGKK